MQGTEFEKLDCRVDPIYQTYVFSSFRNCGKRTLGL